MYFLISRKFLSLSLSLCVCARARESSPRHKSVQIHQEHGVVTGFAASPKLGFAKPKPGWLIDGLSMAPVVLVLRGPGGRGGLAADRAGRCSAHGLGLGVHLQKQRPWAPGCFAGSGKRKERERGQANLGLRAPFRPTRQVGSWATKPAVRCPSPGDADTEPTLRGAASSVRGT